MSATEPQVLRFAPGAGIPNNPHLPVLVYRDVVGDLDDLDTILAAHGWRADWSGTVYDYDHFHSTAHELLAVIGGEADLALGGPEGQTLHLDTGDAVVLPAGTGHRLDRASPEFQVRGAYPRGQDWDLLRAGEDGPEIDARIASVPLPPGDPFTGDQGPLARLWPGVQAS